jgi:peptide/nickel transport system permease protein
VPKFVFTFTDLSIWLVTLAVVIYALRIRRDADLRRTWRHVLRDPAAMCAAVFLLAFGAVALLDSVHFRLRVEDAGAAAPVYSPRTTSVLDWLLQGVIDAREKTYSAPLAYRSFVREVVVADGVTRREFPRLQFGGAHLTDPSRQWSGDVLARSLAGLAAGLAAALVVAILVILREARRRDVRFGVALRLVASYRTDVPWRAVLAAVVVLGAFTGWVAAIWPHYHPFGTDLTGNDVLYQTLKSIRTAAVIGTLSSAATLPLAIALGVLAGFYRGWVDDAIQYFYTVLSAIPSILLIAALVLLIQVWIDKNPQWFDTGLERAEFRLFLLCVILGVTGWSTLCRLLRAETLKLRELDYVQAARAFGVADLRIMLAHILPNVAHLVLIVTVLDFSSLVLYEAVLSYVGVGVDPTSQSFGSMINLARSEMSRDPVVWWNLGAAFTFMLAVVLAANLFADAVRDAFDPRARALRPRRAARQPVAASAK